MSALRATHYEADDTAFVMGEEAALTERFLADGHVILPVDDLSNAACEAVANNIKGTLAIPHPYGRLQFGADLVRRLVAAGPKPDRQVRRHGVQVGHRLDPVGLQRRRAQRGD